MGATRGKGFRSRDVAKCGGSVALPDGSGETDVRRKAPRVGIGVGSPAVSGGGGALIGYTVYRRLASR